MDIWVHYKILEPQKDILCWWGPFVVVFVARTTCVDECNFFTSGMLWESSVAWKILEVIAPVQDRLRDQKKREIRDKRAGTLMNILLLIFYLSTDISFDVPQNSQELLDQCGRAGRFGHNMYVCIAPLVYKFCNVTWVLLTQFVQNSAKSTIHRCQFATAPHTSAITSEFWCDKDWHRSSNCPIYNRKHCCYWDKQFFQFSGVF